MKIAIMSFKLLVHNTDEKLKTKATNSIFVVLKMKKLEIFPLCTTLLVNSASRCA
jgi:hypothetical protein